MLAARLTNTFGISAAAAVFMAAKSAYAEPPPEFRAANGPASSIAETSEIPAPPANIIYTTDPVNDNSLSLKPLEVCAEAEQSTSQIARDIATSNSKFTY